MLQPPKKVLLIITKSDIGGAQTHIDSLIKNLSDKYQFVLCTGLVDQSQLKVDGLTGQPHIIPELNNKLFFPAFSKIYQLIKSEQPDLIHTHSAVASFVGRIAGRLAGIKTLYTVHGWHFVPNTVWKRRIFGWLLELFARPLSFGWIVVSAYDLKLGISCHVLNKHRAWVVPNGVERVNSSTNKMPKDGLELVFVGRATFQKNCLEAIEILENCDHRIRLTMYVTSGDHLSALNQRIKNSPGRT